MTAQIPETLHFHGEKLSLCGCPLGSYLGLAGIQLEFRAPMTCLWRGYVGSWEIVDDRLYLIDLHGKLADAARWRAPVAWLVDHPHPVSTPQPSAA